MTPKPDFAALTRGSAGPLAIAVSGGGDSIALLHLAAQHLGRQLRVVTVDHGLRDVSAELDLVARAARDLDLPHDVLRWDWDGQGSLQARAREARQTLIAHWARHHNITDIALGHTLDDQAETVLMRLARGSGVDGLAGMAAQMRSNGMTWHRPMLRLRRADLRTWLQGQGIAWADDPSNEDTRFDRVRARQMMAQLSDLGLTADRLVQTADHAAAARSSLSRAARVWMRDHARHELGELRLPADVLDLTQDTHRRVLSGAVKWCGRSSYRPSWAPLRAAAQGLRAGRGSSLGGCLLTRSGPDVVIARELAATPAPSGGDWDGWRVTGPMDPDMHIAALGAGVAQVPDWRRHAITHAAAQATPGLWRGGDLIAAPALDPGKWTAQIAADFDSFFD